MFARRVEGGYLVSGKTGTGGQVASGQYRPGSVVSFIGMAPADDPRYVIGVFAHVPDEQEPTMLSPIVMS